MEMTSTFYRLGNEETTAPLNFLLVFFDVAEKRTRGFPFFFLSSILKEPAMALALSCFSSAPSD